MNLNLPRASFRKPRKNNAAVPFSRTFQVLVNPSPHRVASCRKPYQNTAVVFFRSIFQGLVSLSLIPAKSNAKTMQGHIFQGLVNLSLHRGGVRQKASQESCDDALRAHFPRPCQPNLTIIEMGIGCPVHECESCAYHNITTQPVSWICSILRML